METIITAEPDSVDCPRAYEERVHFSHKRYHLSKRPYPPRFIVSRAMISF